MAVATDDPDNGVSREGVINRKSATLSEISDLARGGRAVMLIRFPSRDSTHLEQLQKHHLALADYKPITVRTCVSLRNIVGRKFPRIRWFTLINPSIEMRKSICKFATQLSSIADANAIVDAPCFNHLADA